MKTFWVGLLVGALLGGGGVYLGLTQPWTGSGETAEAAADAGPEVVASKGKKRGKKKRRKKRRGRGNGNEILGDPIVVLSAADRKLVWRGPKVALAARDMDFGSDDEGRSLTQSEIDSGISSRSSAIIECIKDARGNAELASTIILKALVGGNGRVSRARVKAPRYLIENGLARCMQREAKSMSFAATGAQTVVSVPFDLR